MTTQSVLPAEIMHGCLPYGAPAAGLAVCLWLEELGPAFRMSLDGDVFQYYSNVKEHLTAFSLDSNAATLCQILLQVQIKLADLSEVADFERLEVLVPGRRRKKVQADLPQRLTLWRELVGCGCQWWLIHAQLREWQAAWDPKTWDAQRHKSTRKLACDGLKCYSELMKATAKVLEDRLKHGVEGLKTFGLQVEDVATAGMTSRKRKESECTLREEEDKSATVVRSPGSVELLMVERERFKEAVANFCLAIETTARVDVEKPPMEDVTEMQAEIHCASQSLHVAVSELQFKVQVKLTERETLKLTQQIARLQAEKDMAEAAAAADRARFESQQAQAQAEKAEIETALRQKFNAEKIQLEAAAQLQSDTQRAQLEAAFQAERAQLEAAARLQSDTERAQLEAAFKAEKAQLEAAARLKLREEKAQVETEVREEAQACQICLEKPHNVVIFPCLHAHYCEQCLVAHSKINHTCPTCRAAITGTLRYKL